MSGVLKLTDSQVVKLENDIDTSYGQLRETVQRLHQVLDTMEGQWKGVAAGAFDAKQRDINLGIRGIGEALTSTLEKIERMRGDKTNLEEDIRAQVNKVQVDVGAGRSAFDGM